jgi:hypothetical protein
MERGNAVVAQKTARIDCESERNVRGCRDDGTWQERLQ